MKVSKYMIRDVQTVSPSTGIRKVYSLFKEYKVSSVPVVDDENNLLGIITITDLFTALIPDYFEMIDDFLFIDDFGALEKDFSNLPMLELFVAEDLMQSKVVTIKESASLLKAPALMKKYNIRRLPVVKGTKLVGIITRMDICRGLFEGDGT